MSKTVVIVDEAANFAPPYVTYIIEEGEPYETIEQFLREEITGNPNETAITLDSFEQAEGGWYEYDYGRFAVVRGQTKEIGPVEKTVEVELQ